MVNGIPINSKGGAYVIPFKDVIRLDGKVVTGWEDINVSDQEDEATERFEYISSITNPWESPVPLI